MMQIQALPPTYDAGNSVGCWKNEISGQSRLKQSRNNVKSFTLQKTDKILPSGWYYVVSHHRKQSNMGNREFSGWPGVGRGNFWKGDI